MKNAIVYKAELPDAKHLAADLAERPWRELAFGESIRHAFLENDEGIRVHTFPGGYAICLRTDEKIIPTSVVNAETQKRTKKLEKEQDRKVSKEQRRDIKEQVYDEFLKRALIKQRYTWAYYDQDHQLLFVDGSKDSSDALMGELIQACSSVKTQTIHIADIKQGLTTRLMETIMFDQNRFGALGLGTDLSLVRKNPYESMERVVYTESDITREEVLKQLSIGFSVERLEVVMYEVAVSLTDKFHFKRFEWPELETDEEADEVERWEHETSVKVNLARGIVEELCRLMEYEPPKLDDAA